MRLEVRTEHHDFIFNVPVVVDIDPVRFGQELCFIVLGEFVDDPPGWFLVRADQIAVGTYVMWFRPEKGVIEEYDACGRGCCKGYKPSAHDLAEAIKDLGHKVIVTDGFPGRSIEVTIKGREAEARIAI